MDTNDQDNMTGTIKELAHFNDCPAELELSMSDKIESLQNMGFNCTSAWVLTNGKVEEMFHVIKRSSVKGVVYYSDDPKVIEELDRELKELGNT